MKIHFMSFVIIALLSTGALAAEDATKNHRAEKRQDDSFLFFGGWRPVKPSSRSGFYHGSASGRYHDLISALPGSLDPSSRYYTHALPSTYYKDIYSYYPRPAIKPKPKKNTPVYMERYMPQRQQQPKQSGRGRGVVSNGSPQFVDIQNLDLKQLRGLQDIILQTKELPLSQLNLQNKGGKQFDIVEVSLHSLPQDSHNTGSRNVNSYRGNQNREPQRNNKGGNYGRRVPQNAVSAQQPLQYQYVTVPKVKSLLPQAFPKDISITPVKLPHSVPSVDDIINLKNIQVVEVPVPLPVSNGKSNRGSQYGSRGNAYSQPQYRMPSPKSPQKVSFPANTYYAHQTEQPRKHHARQQPAKSGYNQQQLEQPQIEAELIKLSENEIQHLLKNIQVVSKNSQDLLKILPIAEAAHKSHQEQIQLVLALPQGNHGGQNIEISGYGARNHGAGEQVNGYRNKAQYVAVPQQDIQYENKEQYVAVPQQDIQYENKEQYVVVPEQYPSHETASVSHNSGGYRIENQNQAVEHNAAGYQIDDPSGQSYGQNYQNAVGQNGYDQNGAYQEAGHKNEYEASGGQQEYEAAGYNSPSQQRGVHSQREQYIQVVSPQSGNGYRREPVLAVEIHKGQSIEDAIKAIDPETLQRLGAHGKEGLEIEIVEIPADEYSAESKKTETYVASTNSTTKAPIKKTTSTTTVVTVSRDKKSTTSQKKS